MILMPIFMPQPKVGFYIRSLEEKMEITARREAVLQVLSENDNLTLQEIADKSNFNQRTVQAILTALQKYNNVRSLIIDNRKVWQIVWN